MQKAQRTAVVVWGVLAFGSAPAVAQAGILDGSLNNANVISNVNVLGVSVDARVGPRDANSNENVRAAVGVQNNKIVDARVSDPTPSSSRARRGRSKSAPRARSRR